jgi:hypothetical protein
MGSPITKGPEDEMRSRTGKHAGRPDVELDLRPGHGFETYTVTVPDARSLHGRDLPAFR